MLALAIVAIPQTLLRKRVKEMAKRTCELNKKKVMFPDDCKDCMYLKPRGKILCCSYKPEGGKKA